MSYYRNMHDSTTRPTTFDPYTDHERHNTLRDRQTDRQTNRPTADHTAYERYDRLTRKLSYRKADRAMRPIYGCPENFQQSLTTPTAILFPNFEWAFVPIEPINVHAKFEIRSFPRS